MNSSNSDTVFVLGDIDVELEGHIAVIEIRRPPNNFLDVDLLSDIATALERLDQIPQCRAVVLAATGKHFCAGGNLKQRLRSKRREKSLSNPVAIPTKRQGVS